MRIRTVKPEFWKSETLGQVSRDARLLAIGLLNLADDEGLFVANPRLIQAELFPYDEEPPDVAALLEDLEAVGFINRHAHPHEEGRFIGELPTFLIHQKVNRPTRSRLAPLIESSLRAHGGLTEGSPPEGKGRERKGAGKGDPPAPSLVSEVVEKWNETAEAQGWRKSRKAKADLDKVADALSRSEWRDGRADEPGTAWQDRLTFLKVHGLPWVGGPGDKKDWRPDLSWFCSDKGTTKALEAMAEPSRPIDFDDVMAPCPECGAVGPVGTPCPGGCPIVLKLGATPCS